MATPVPGRGAQVGRARAMAPMKANSLSGVVGLLFIVLIAPGRTTAESVNLMELQKGWRLTSADKVNVGGEQVSKGEFDVSSWYPVQHMPSTVLQALAI